MKISLLQPLMVEEGVVKEFKAEVESRGHEFVYYDTKTTDASELIKRAEGAEVVIVDQTPLPASVINEAKELKYISVAFTGYDHVDKEAVLANDIKVSNAAGYADIAVAELTIGLAIALLREFKTSDIDTRKGEDFKTQLVGNEIHGKTVGIIGTGRIGKLVAERFKAFGVKLIGYNRSQHQEAIDLGLEYKSLSKVMQESDIISVNLPLNDETKGLISREMLELMQPSAIFINTARGPVVDNKALSDLLNAGKIRAAGIDVFDKEPPLDNNDPILSAKNTILTPHIGYLTHEAMQKRADIAFSNVLAYLDGRFENLVKY